MTLGAYRGKLRLHDSDDVQNPTLRFAVDRLNESLDVAVAERERLKTARIVGMTWQVIRTNCTRELRVPQDSHNFGKVHVAFVREVLVEVIETGGWSRELIVQAPNRNRRAEVISVAASFGFSKGAGFDFHPFPHSNLVNLTPML